MIERSQLDTILNNLIFIDIERAWSFHHMVKNWICSSIEPKRYIIRISYDIAKTKAILENFTEIRFEDNTDQQMRGSLAYISTDDYAVVNFLKLVLEDNIIVRDLMNFI